MQPILKPIEKKYQDMTDKLNEAGLKAVQEMSKRPYSLQEAEANLDRLREEMGKNRR